MVGSVEGRAEEAERADEAEDNAAEVESSAVLGADGLLRANI